ncbi:hypothetical protein GCM10027018_03800 [Paenibacillus thermoaerophilus]
MLQFTVAAEAGTGATAARANTKLAVKLACANRFFTSFTLLFGLDSAYADAVSLLLTGSRNLLSGQVVSAYIF